MPRKWQRKCPDINVSNYYILQAVEMVTEKHLPIRQVATTMSISKSALANHVSEYKNSENEDETEFQQNLTCIPIYALEHKDLLSKYLIKATKKHYGLSTIQVRTLAFQYAEAFYLNYTDSWTEK
ncbi:hypothetical protein JTB14_022161 [Gonioctena quinquepunctata]|nr:hypothetical protein JTB14_022161 [Gonioctena quinquepunctata]